jgi:hypothetical protein
MGRELRRRENNAAVEQAWRIHDAQAAWTAAVDAKASFSFALQSAIIAAIGALVAADRVFRDLHDWRNWFLIAGGLGLVTGVGFAAAVVAPRLRPQDLRKESASNHIYFGHLRHWKGRASELAARLPSDDMLPQLTRQIIIMGDIAWRKHRCVQISIWAGVAGGALLLAYAVLSTLPAK